MSLQRIAPLVLGASALVWYYACIVVIGLQLSTDPANQQFRQFMSLSLTTIGVALATFVGMLLGFQGIKGGVQQTAKEVEVQSTEHRPALLNRLQQLGEQTAGTSLQWAAVIVYLVSLPLAIYFWYLKGDGTDPAIINLGKSVLGLMAGALSVVLNLPKA